MFKNRVSPEWGALFVLSSLMFFFSAQVSLTIYIDSSFLNDTILRTPSLNNLALFKDPERIVGAIYMLASIMTIVGLFMAPRVLRRIGNYRATLFAFLAHMLMLLLLSATENGLFVIPLFVIEAALMSLLFFNLDIFLESYTKDEHTGVIRGIFLTVGSISWLLPPMLAGTIIENYGYSLAYFSGAIILIPALILLVVYMRNFKDLAYDDAPLLPSRSQLQQNPDVWHGLACTFFLQFFYAWMIIYAPIFLHDHVGFSWGDIGLMLTLALTPFVLLPSPLGWLADNVMGEKELLVLGFLLMAVTSFVIPHLALASSAFMTWVIVLFVGRCGAATVEAMAEIYFFKQIDGHNAGLMGYFRRMRPMAFIAAPLIASILFQFDWFSFEMLFSILGIIMLGALYFPMRLKDTR
jgi:MFS family permease